MCSSDLEAATEFLVLIAALLELKSRLMLPNEEISTFAELAVVIIPLGPRDDMSQIGRRIFAGMRELDRRGMQRILVRGVKRTGIGLAIWDRLLRAAEGRVIEADD